MTRPRIRPAARRDLPEVLRLVRALAEFEKLVAYAFYFFTYSTFLARPTLFLEDLFVRSESRRAGIGARRIRELARIARRHGCGRFEWTALDWNRGAREFYRRLGARRLREWELHRVDGPGLGRLASQGRSRR